MADHRKQPAGALLRAHAQGRAARAHGVRGVAADRRCGEQHPAGPDDRAMCAELVQRARALLFRRRWHEDLDDEMRFHLEQDTAARSRAGADPATARRAALLAFGGLDRYREATRAASGVRPFEDLVADGRFAFRALRRNPAFTLTAILVLALAFGAATGVFGIVHSVLIADLPYPQADRLVRVYQQF